MLVPPHLPHAIPTVHTEPFDAVLHVVMHHLRYDDRVKHFVCWCEPVDEACGTRVRKTARTRDNGGMRNEDEHEQKEGVAIGIS